MTIPSQGGAPDRSRADSELASTVKRLLVRGEHAAACERFEELVAGHQRRANRIAYYYLRDPADVDEAVQDAFVKAFVHLPSFREDLFFELWFTRIIVNTCLDRIKARRRRTRWLAPGGREEHEAVQGRASQDPSPEASLLVAERRAHLRAAVDRLPERQRAVVVLSQFEGRSARAVAEILGLNETTVRVHLFRAIRSLRKQLSAATWLPSHDTRLPAACEVSSP